MLQVRCDANVPNVVQELVRQPLERAACSFSGLGEAFVYCVASPGGARELVVRVSTVQGAVPVLFRLDALSPEQVETAIRGTLMGADL